MIVENLEQHKQFLEEKWGEAADCFPGEFHQWLLDRIKEKIENNDTFEIFEDIMIYSGEIN